MISKTNKKLLALFLAVAILLILPVSFASEDAAANTTQNIAVGGDSTVPSLADDAGQIYVDASNGKSNGTGSENDPVQTISQGLNLVRDGGTIYLTGEFAGEGNTNLTFDGNVDNIAFVGLKDAVINGNFSTSFVLIERGTYSFEKISFVNHFKGETENNFGGAICNVEGKVTFNQCLFENNSISGINKANGGAIDNSGTMTIRNCTFQNNSAYVSNSSGFRKNAADGGAISNLGKLYAYDTLFVNNTVLRNGGAIRTQDGASSYIENCEFIGNFAGYHMSGGSFGGAIYTWDCELTLVSSTFKNNRIYDASGYGAQGGAISSDRGSGIINIKNCEFTNNTADGVGTVNGQSIYIGAVTANINYCSIDTGVYSISQSSDFNYNWWEVSDGDFKKLIENLPPNAKVKTFAEAKISSNDSELQIGKTVEITVKLCWNGTDSQTYIDLIPTRPISLKSNCGNLANESGYLTIGIFDTTLKINSTANPLITADISNVIVKFDFTKEEAETELNVTCKNITEGETATIVISANKEIDGICLIDIGEGRYYAELVKGKASASIADLKEGEYDVIVKYLNNNYTNTLNATAKLAVSKKIQPELKVNITQNKRSAIVKIEIDTNSTDNITVTVDGKQIKTQPVSDNAVEAEIADLSCAIHGIEIAYAGDLKYEEFITVNKTDASIIVKPGFTYNACDVKAKEQCGKLTFELKDIDGNILSNKTVQVALNCKVHNLTTDENGKANLNINLENAKVYTCAISFGGDETYNASPLSVTKVTVNKKKTTISASAKTFKANAKTKTISVTLKTVKNQYDGKTYLYKGKKITLTVNGKTYSAKTDSKGVAKFNVKLTKKGKYSAKVKFGGDSTYKSSNKSIKVTIK
ncbi:MAG: hypothetical protein IJF83_02995 [Methanobrevibacter sp.]|nr:hypothetical protein [Methanobrevibacter sp.]